MSLFTIDISSLLMNAVGSVAEFQFSEDIPVDTWEDLVCRDILQMEIRLLRMEYGINCIIQKLDTTITIPSENRENIKLSLKSLSREFHLKKNTWDTDDIEYIDIRDATIDLTHIVEQELLIAGL